jgi:hypothetical protein
MNHGNQRLKPHQTPFWKRILERHQFTGRLLRAPVPMVLFRHLAPPHFRQARKSFPSHVPQYQLAMHMQFFWQQWLGNILGPRTTLEKFTHTASKELQHRFSNLPGTNPASSLAEARRKPDRIVGERQTHSVPAHSPEIVRSRSVPAAGSHVSRTNLQNTLVHTLRDRSTTIPGTVRLFTERTLKIRTQTIFAGPSAIAAPLARISGPAERRQRIFPRTTSPLPFEAAATVPHVNSRGEELTHVFRLKTEVLPRAIVALKSPLLHPAQSDGEGQDLLKRARTRLYEQSAWLNLAQPAAGSAGQLPTPEPPAAVRPPTSVRPLQPQLDIGRLSEEVYRHIQRKIRIERERRGM